MKKIRTGLILLALLTLMGCPTPTDGETTKPADTKETVATPTFSPVAGTFTSAQNVTIACATSGASIYYTINGDTPTASSTPYTAAISVTATTTVKAIAIKEGMTNSAVATALYTIEDPVSGLAWESVGLQEFSESNIRYSSFAVSPKDGSVWMAYTNNYIGGGLAHVMRFNGSAWERIGTDFTKAWDTPPSIAFKSDGTPYVAFGDGKDGDYYLSVVYWNGTAWTDYGTRQCSAFATGTIKISFNSSDVLYGASSNYGGKVTVWTYDGSSVTTLGTADGIEGTWFDFALAPDGTPWLATENWSENIEVRYYTGSSWTLAGSTGISSSKLSSGTFCGFAIDIDSSGHPYVAYVDKSAYKLSVKKFSGGTWSLAGSADFSPAYAAGPDIILASDDVPVVSFIADSVTHVMALDGTVWTELDQEGVGATNKTYVNLTVDPVDNLYLSYAVVGTLKAGVMKLGDTPYSGSGSGGEDPQPADTGNLGAEIY